MSIKPLITHIQSLIAADTSLAKLNVGLVNYGIPSKLPAIYLDGITYLDDKQDSYTFNVCYVTTDMSIDQLDVAHALLSALKLSPCVQAQQLLARPEPEQKRSRWMIPCRFYPNLL